MYAMHPILEKLSLLSPLRYYIEGCESIFFRGTSFIDLWQYFAGVLVLGSVLYWYGFRKIGKLFKKLPTPLLKILKGRSHV